MRFATGLSASTLLAALFALPTAWAAGTLIGTSSGQLAYDVLAGDTLELIANKTTGNIEYWTDIARANKVSNTKALRVGTRLIIPRHLVPERNAVAQVLSSKGAVTVQESSAAAPGHLGEGSKLETAQGASVLLRLQDGTKIKIEPGSRVILERMRQYYASDAVDARIRLESGRLDVDSPERRQFPLEVKTQRATAAVRGTVFRVSADGPANTTEVLRGKIAYQAARKALDLPSGDGLALPANSDTPVVEKLAAAPSLSLRPIYEEVAPTLTWLASKGLNYRAVVTRDPQGLEVVSNAIVQQDSARFDSAEDGKYFLQVRAVSPNGIEGYTSQQAFEIQARPLAPEFLRIDSDTTTPVLRSVKLVWSPSGSPETIVQIASDLSFQTILLETRSSTNQLAVPEILYGKKSFFRLASSLPAGGTRTRGPFGPAREILW